MTTPVTPKLAAGIVLLRQSSVTDWEFFWARRSNKMPFMSGFHAFPGGRLDKSDAELTIEQASSPEQAALCVCAIREA
ncbi:MAG TPA: MBL fold metallo-hydrolase, partial [Acidobacteriota bacterium]|nr:MBL fold metallo-hydrolase [Acidobacteriota bacterium]